MEKFRKNLLDENLKAHYDSLTNQFMELLPTEQRKNFCDQLARKINGAYRVGILVKNISSKPVLRDEKSFLTLVYEWGFTFGYERMRKRNPYIENSKEYREWERGFAEGRTKLEAE